MQGKIKKNARYKVKKAYNGIQKVNPDYTDALSKQEGKDSIQNGASQLIGTGLNTIAPGVGTALNTVSQASSAITKDDKGVYKNDAGAFVDGILNPVERIKRFGQGLGKLFKGDIKGGISTAIIGDQSTLKTDLKNAEYKAKNAEFNNSISTSAPLQRNQFKKGGLAKSKLIEIEGKVSPEIHTDSSMTKVKNLGTTPHSKGGDKVLATEGDVVFPTQNSPEKYNKIMKAIQEKDLPTLRKEKNKLPEDTGNEYRTGTKNIDDDPLKAAKEKSLKAKEAYEKNKTKEKEERLANNTVKYNEELRSGIENSIAKLEEQGFKRKVDSSNVPTKRGLDGEYEVGKILNYNKNSTNKPTGNTASNKNVSTEGSNNKSTTSNTKKSSSWMNPLQEIQPLSYKDSLGNPPKLGKDSFTKSIAKQAEAYEKQSQIQQTNTGDPLKDHLNSALEIAPVIHNLGQGLFGKAEKVSRDFLNPDMMKYTDMSDGLRSQSNSMESVAKSNARNLSGGNVSNYRSNAQSASNDNFVRQGQINTQEIARQDAVNQANVQIGNQTKAANLDLKNKYDEMDAMNRGVKSGALAKGLEGLGQIGTRNILQKNELQANKTSLEAYMKGMSYNPTFNNKGEYQSTEFKQPTVLPESSIVTKEQQKRIDQKQRGNNRIFNFRGRR